MAPTYVLLRLEGHQTEESLMKMVIVFNSMGFTRLDR
jgi:hypothetical protein